MPKERFWRVFPILTATVATEVTYLDKATSALLRVCSRIVSTKKHVASSSGVKIAAGIIHQFR